MILIRGPDVICVCGLPHIIHVTGLLIIIQRPRDLDCLGAGLLGTFS